MTPNAVPFPLPLDRYAPVPGGLLDTILSRVHEVPFNLAATLLFFAAITHTFLASRFTRLSHSIQKRHDDRRLEEGLERAPSFLAGVLHFFGEVEVVFGLWVVPLAVVIALANDWNTVKHYLNGTVNYTEPLFVVVIMAMASTRPTLLLAERILLGVARIGGGGVAASWLSILVVGPLVGSLITEPAAMTICALLLGRQFFRWRPDRTLRYATLGLLFVNVSIGGTLTHFAAPPVLMVARTWGWDLGFMMARFGWRAVLAVSLSSLVYYFAFRRRLASLEARRRAAPETSARGEGADVWVTAVHVAFLAWTVANSHYPAMFIGGFLIFLGFTRATAPHQTPVELRAPLLVGFFLAGLVIHGGLQGWWIAPVLGNLGEVPLFVGASVLTAVNDNALITYLATLVPGLTDALRYAVVAGAVTGGGLTVIANAPNPAGQALLARYFEEGVSPFWLLVAATIPTLIAALCFMT